MDKLKAGQQLIKKTWKLTEEKGIKETIKNKKVEVPVFKKPSWFENFAARFSKKELETPESYKNKLEHWITDTFVKEESWLTNKVKENISKNINNFTALSEINDQETMKELLVLAFFKAKLEYYNEIEEKFSIKDQLKQKLDAPNTLNKNAAIGILAHTFNIKKEDLSPNLRELWDTPYKNLENESLKSELQDEIMFAICENITNKPFIARQLNKNLPPSDDPPQISMTIDNNFANISDFIDRVDEIKKKYSLIGYEEKNLPKGTSILDLALNEPTKATSYTSQYNSILSGTLKKDKKPLERKLQELDKNVENQYSGEDYYSQFKSKLVSGDQFIESRIINLDDFEYMHNRERGTTAFNEFKIKQIESEIKSLGNNFVSYKNTKSLSGKPLFKFDELFLDFYKTSSEYRNNRNVEQLDSLQEDLAAVLLRSKESSPSEYLKQIESLKNELKALNNFILETQFKLLQKEYQSAQKLHAEAFPPTLFDKENPPELAKLELKELENTFQKYSEGVNETEKNESIIAQMQNWKIALDNFNQSLQSTLASALPKSIQDFKNLTAAYEKAVEGLPLATRSKNQLNLAKWLESNGVTLKLNVSQQAHITFGMGNEAVNITPDNIPSKKDQQSITPRLRAYNQILKREIALINDYKKTKLKYETALATAKQQRTISDHYRRPFEELFLSGAFNLETREDKYNVVAHLKDEQKMKAFTEQVNKAVNILGLKKT